MPTLQEMLGDSYKEGMTFDDVAKFFEGKNYADLSTGAYVDKGKYDNQINTLSSQLQDTKAKLNAKLTDDEKNAQHEQAQQKRIEELEGLLKTNTIASNKTLANNNFTSLRDTLGIKSTDKSYDEFINNITGEDSTKTSSITEYVNKLVTEAYKKGEENATKNSLGNFGKTKGEGVSGKGVQEIGSLGKQLAHANAQNTTNFDYFR